MEATRRNQCIIVGGKSVYLTAVFDFVVTIALMILGNETGCCGHLKIGFDSVKPLALLVQFYNIGLFDRC